MRIWIINHYAAPPSMAGGTRHYQFAKQLINRGHEVILFAANYNHFSHQLTDVNLMKDQLDYHHDVPFLWIPTPPYHGNTIARFKNMLSFSWKILHKKYTQSLFLPDIIIGSSPHLFAALSAQLLAKRFKVPFILEVRDLWPESLIDLGRMYKHHPLIKVMQIVENYLYKRADRIISLLPSADQYLIKCGVKPENILWLPNTIDTTHVPENLIKEESDTFIVMYAGAHGLANDLDTVLHAAKILQDQSLAERIRIYLIGEGPEKSRLKERAKQLNIHIITFLDAVSKNKIYNILNKANAFLMLLKNSPVFRWGISPNKLFDYLMMGRPIIFGVNTPFNPVDQVNAGISIKPSDPSALARAIHQLSLLSPSQLTDMGMRGKEFVIKHHHIQTLTDKLEEWMINTIDQARQI